MFAISVTCDISEPVDMYFRDIKSSVTILNANFWSLWHLQCYQLYVFDGKYTFLPIYVHTAATYTCVCV